MQAQAAVSALRVGYSPLLPPQLCPSLATCRKVSPASIQTKTCRAGTHHVPCVCSLFSLPEAFSDPHTSILHPSQSLCVFLLQPTKTLSDPHKSILGGKPALHFRASAWSSFLVETRPSLEGSLPIILGHQPALHFRASACPSFQIHTRPSLEGGLPIIQGISLPIISGQLQRSTRTPC